MDFCLKYAANGILIECVVMSMPACKGCEKAAAMEEGLLIPTKPKKLIPSTLVEGPNDSELPLGHGSGTFPLNAGNKVSRMMGHINILHFSHLHVNIKLREKVLEECSMSK
jgi:hypothetical protein